MTFKIDRVVGLKSSISNAETCTYRPRSRLKMYDARKVDWSGYRMVKQLDDMFVCVDTDGRTTV